MKQFIFLYLFIFTSIPLFSNIYVDSYRLTQKKNVKSISIYKVIETNFNFMNKLPHVLDVFPEIKNLFFKKNKKSCKSDKDCEFPLVCCDFPEYLNGKECCNGGSVSFINSTRTNHFAY